MAATTLEEMESHVQHIAGPAIRALEATHKLMDTGAIAKTTPAGKADYVADSKNLKDHVSASCTVCLNFSG